MKSSPSILSDQAIQPLLDSFNSSIVILDEKNQIVLVNRIWRDFCKNNDYTDEDSGVGKDYFKVCASIMGIGTEIAQRVLEGISKVLSGESFEENIEFSHGVSTENLWFRVSITKFVLDQNFVILTHCNTTHHKIIEENLSETEHLFKSVIEQASEGISIIDSDGRIIEWNSAEERITGCSRDEVIGRFMWDVQVELRAGKEIEVPVEVMKASILEMLKKGHAPWAGKPSIANIQKLDGTQATIESVFFPIKHNHGFLACSISRDISELKESKKAQQLSESRFHTYVNYSPIIAMIINQKGDFLDVNPQAILKLGFSEEEFLKMNIVQLIPVEEQGKTTELLENLQNTGQASAELQTMKKDGDHILLFSKAVELPDQSIMILCNDISELRESQTKLQESEAFLNNILDNIPSMITVKDAVDFQFLKVNHPVEEFLEMNSREIIGKTAMDLFETKDAAFYLQQDQLAINDKQTIDIPFRKVTKKSNKKSVLREKKIPLFDKMGNPRFVLSISEDISEQVNLEAEANARLAKLEAVSQLSTRLQTIFSLEELFPALLEILLRIFGASMGSIWKYVSGKDELVPVFFVGGGQDYQNLISEPLKPGEGIPGMVFLTQKPSLSQNYKSDPHIRKNKNSKLHNELGGMTVPLRTTNNVIGVINISARSDRKFTEEDIKLFLTLSEIAGNAILNISLQDQTEQRLKRLSALSAIDRAITSSFDLHVSLEILVSNVISQLNMDASSILLFNPHSQLLEYSIGQGFRTKVAEGTFLKLGESYAGKAASLREFVQVSNLYESNNILFKNIQESEKFLSYFGVPLVAKGQVKGVLEVFSRSLFEPDEDWINFLKSLAEQASIAIENAQMVENLYRSNLELNMAYNATIEGWSHALDLRDKETEGHTLRVTEITEQLARAFKLPENEIKFIRWGSLLHDIGKLGVPDGILLKPGPLTDEEWVVMRKHPRYAYEMLAPITYLAQAIDIPYCHHEKWDGTGYPRGLKGEQIPLSARIFAVVDIWDALRSDRPYRKAWPLEKVIEHIRSLSGNHLDPKVVEFCLNSGLLTHKI